MAEAALSVFLPAIFEKLTSSILKEFGLFKDRRKDIQKLTNNLSAILCVLADAEEKQWKDAAVKNWLKKLRDAAYDADDILDQCTTEATRRKLETQGRVLKKIRGFFSASNPLLFDLRMAYRIKEIRERLNDIAEERSNFHLREGVCTSESKSREKTASFVIESDVFGRKEDKEKLVDLLLNSGNKEHVSVIPVVGMGGLGKTTLAKQVYGDATVKGHFNPKIWVCVSDEFDVARLTKAILENVTESKSDLEDLDVLQRRLREHLTGKKFLLVLDDVWEENRNKWESLMGYLRAGDAGSKIIVTTRSEKVASIMTTGETHHLKRLSDDDCWSLFKQRAFRQGHQDKPNFINLGREIVNKCGGIPLIAKAIGALMFFKTEESEWQLVKESEFWNVLEQEDDRTLHALRLSYYHLSPQLKRCFAYCSVFPKDHWISKEELIQMWMAQGIIQPPQAGRRTEEEIGRECFNNLLWRSFFQDAEKDEYGNVERCKMHDVMHDLALSISEDACSNFVSENIIPDGCRHLSFKGHSWDAVSTTLNTSSKIQHLRTLFCQDRWMLGLSVCLPLYLRVLGLGGVILSKNTVNSISQLKQLRYLHLSYLDLIPESFIKLHNLQTLRLTNCYRLKKLPKDMRKMTNLRHLFMPDVSLTHMPTEMGELKYLQTLSVFVVGEESGNSIRELQDLNLEGELSIRNLENVRDRVNAEEAKLSEKAELRRLKLSWTSIAAANDFSLSEHTLEGLQPHPNLRSLEVRNYAGEICPHWMSCSSLPNLVELFLINCRGWKQEQLPLLNQLEQLKILRIGGMEAVKCIGDDFYGHNAFPLLEQLYLSELENLEEWSGCNGGGQSLPCLQELRVEYCPKLKCLPRNLGNLAALESLTIFSCKKLESLFAEESVEGQNHLCLQWLHVYNCEGLKSLDLLGFTSLKNVFIYNCKNLASLVGGMHHPTAHTLERLEIRNCSELGSLLESVKQFTSLRYLHIIGCDSVTCLPEGLRHATSLEELCLEGMRNLVALPEWMENFSSLRTLHILYSPNLVSLPVGFQNLRNLQNLRIRQCPQLEQRCQEDTGEDWHKIRHIPNLSIW